MYKLKKFGRQISQFFLQNQDKKILDSVREVIAAKLTYLEPDALQELVQVVIQNERRNLQGNIIETGCALGGSAIAMAKNKDRNRQLFIYDVFGIIPPPSERDGQDVHERYKVITSGKSEGIGGNEYYGYEEDLYQKVYQSFVQFDVEPKVNNVHLVKGLFEDTLQVSSPVALAHIDCDWYDSVIVCLERIVPNLVQGGTLVMDDYYAWSGCKKAVDKYFKDKKIEFHFLEKKRLHIIRK